MPTDDAQNADSLTALGGRGGDDAEHSPVVGRGPPATKPRRQRTGGPQSQQRPPSETRGLYDVREGVASAASLARDSVYRRLLAAGDLTAATGAFLITTSVLGSDSPGIWMLVAIVMIVPVCKVAGLYDRDQYLIHKTTLEEAPAIFSLATLYTLLAFLGGAHFVEGTFGRAQAAVLWMLLFVGIVLMRALTRRLAGRLVEPERCVILGNADTAHWLSTKLRRSEGVRTVVVGRIPLGPSDLTQKELPVLGTLDSLERLLGEHEVDRVLIAPRRGDSEQRTLDTIRVVKRLGVRISVLPRFFEAVGSAYEFEDVEGAALLGVHRYGLSPSSRLIKRSFDLFGATVGLLVLAPLMAMIALAVKIDSRGPVFFRQRRVGREDHLFEIYKFRTMAEGADGKRRALADRNEAGGGLFKIADDPRITRVGRFLRRTSLDELPQLLNVLRGDMSLVGPRPLVVDEDCLVEGLNRHRLLLPPGVTGLWQIFGSARIPLEEMVKIDYLYGASWSLWLDIKILVRTVPFVLGQRGL